VTTALATLISVALFQDGNYFIIVGLEGTDDAAGQKVDHEEKQFMCPADLPGKTDHS